MATIQGIYIALFGRPADPAGLEFFNGATKDGADLTAIGDLASTAEYQSRFEGLDNIQIINSIYQSLFGRDADLAGLNYFAAELAAGRQTINTIAINIYDGAQGDDKTILENKETAANLFTASIDTGSEVVAYRGDDAAASGRAFLSPITADEASIPTQAQVDAAIKAIVDDAPSGNVGETFILTANTTPYDTFVGTTKDDTFKAAASTLQDNDVLDGGAGNDTLEATFASGAAVKPVLSSIETIKATTLVAGGNLDLSSSTGVETISVTGTGDFVVTGAAATTDLVINNYNKEFTYTADFSGAADVLDVTASGLGSAAALTVAGGTVETLNIASTGATANSLALSGTFGKTVVTGAAALTLLETAAQANGATIDASAATGDVVLSVDVDTGGSVNASKFTGIDGYILRDTTAGADNINLFNVATGSKITAAADLGVVVVTTLGSASNTADVLDFTLKNSATTAADVDITSITAANIETINIHSNGAPTTGVVADQTNEIGTLTATALTKLVIDGASATSIVVADVTHNANVTIDGSAATGALTITSNIGDNAATDRVVTINGGSGADVFFGSDADVNYVFTGGAGNDTFKIADGSIDDEITDFSAGDIISTDGGSVAGAFVNALALSAGDQATVEAAGTLQDAALAAAGFVGGAALANANEAIAFTYQGLQYIYLDETNALAGTDSFDLGDSIVQVHGLTGTSTFASGAFLFDA